MGKNNKTKWVIGLAVLIIGGYALLGTDAGKNLLNQTGSESFTNIGTGSAPVSGTQTYTGDLTIGFDHVDKYAGTALTDDTDVDVDVYQKRTDGTYKLLKHSTSGSAIVGLNTEISTLYVRPSVPDNDFYFLPTSAVDDNPRITGWFFEDITGDGTDDFVLTLSALNVESLGTDDNGNPKFTIGLEWLDYTIPTSFLNVGGDKDYGVGTGSQTTNKDIALLLTEGDGVGIKNIEFNFNSTVSATEWDEAQWCITVPNAGRECLDDMDRDKFTSTTVYTWDFGNDFDELLYIAIPLGADTSPEFEVEAHSSFGSAAAGYAVTVTVTYKEADGDTLTTNTVEIYEVVG